MVDRPDLVTKVGRFVAHRGLSGFLGFDVIFDRDETAWLIEMNPRITTPCRIQGPFGAGPITAAAAACGVVARRGGAIPPRDLFASFPLAWLNDPFEPRLAACAGVLPWAEPAMLREALRPLWPERGLVASMPSRVMSLASEVRGSGRADYRRRSFGWWLREGGLAADRPMLRRSAPTLIAD